MKNQVVASENDWSGLTNYYRDADGNRISVGVNDLPKFLKDVENAGRKIEKIPTVKFQDRQGNDFVVPEDRVRDFFYENAANKREVAEVQEWERKDGSTMPIAHWKDSGKAQEEMRAAGYRPASEWTAHGGYRLKDLSNAVRHAFSHAEDWGLVRNQDGSVDVADTAMEMGGRLAGAGMGAGETYGDMRLALGALGKLGKAAIPMAFGAQAVEGTIEDPAVQREGAAASAVAVVNGVANALGMGFFGKLMHAYALKGAAKQMQKTFGKALAIAFGESVAGGLDMAMIEGANQLARGIAGVEDAPTGKVDEDGNPEMRAATTGERVKRAANALLHGTLMTLGLKAAELSPRIAYSGRGMTKAVSFDVENARREYAPKVARVAEAARALQMHGEAITRGPWFDDVKGVSTNGEVVFKDGTVYYPAKADRNVTVTNADGKPGGSTRR